MITVARSNTRVTPNPDYPAQRVVPGALARLLSEDWAEMTAAANASPNHVSSLDRWIRKAKEANPRLSEEQAQRMGQHLKDQHYIRMGRLSAAAKSAAREAELDGEAA